MDNIIAINHHPEEKFFELTTTVHEGDGFFIMGSGGSTIKSLTYKISEANNSKSYESLTKYLENIS
jgi:hypothetical protein